MKTQSKYIRHMAIVSFFGLICGSLPQSSSSASTEMADNTRNTESKFFNKEWSMSCRSNKTPTFSSEVSARVATINMSLSSNKATPSVKKLSGIFKIILDKEGVEVIDSTSFQCPDFHISVQEHSDEILCSGKIKSEYKLKNGTIVDLSQALRSIGIVPDTSDDSGITFRLVLKRTEEKGQGEGFKYSSPSTGFGEEYGCRLADHLNCSDEVKILNTLHGIDGCGDW